MRITVILPCLNEEKTIENIIKRLRDTASKQGYNMYIIAVDDFSEDNTHSLLEGKADKIIRLKKRLTLSEVIKKGLKEACNIECDIVLHIDADGQYSPEELPRLIKPIKESKADFVIGNRQFMRLKHMPFLNKAGNAFFTLLVSLIIKKKISDSQSGYRAMKLKVAKDIRLTSKYTYTQEEIIRVSLLGYTIKEVPVSFMDRKYGGSRLIKSRILYGLKVVVDLTKIIIKG